MQKLLTWINSLIWLAGSIAVLQAQDLETLRDNTQQLQVTMTMDHREYFPAETGVITVLVVNPTSAPLQVIAPFYTECFNVLVPNPDGSFKEFGADMCPSWDNISTSPTTIFAPGERRQYVLRTYDSSFAIQVSPLGTPTVPRSPGSYVLHNAYNAAAAAFAVVAPHLDTAAVIRVKDQPNPDPEPGDTSVMRRYVDVFAVRWNDQSYLCVSQSLTNSDPVIADVNGNVHTGSMPGPYKRIATSANPITSITGTADDADNLTITWTDSTGAQHITPYPANGGDNVAPVVISYRVLFGDQTFELNTSTRNRLPWQITGIEAVFSKPITHATLNSIIGVTATEIRGLNTNALRWKINPIAIGNVSTTLLATGSDAIADAVGNALGGGRAFSRSFRVLWGDFDDNGIVELLDIAGVTAAFASGNYHIFADMNGDGVVDADDVRLVTSRVGTVLR